MKGRFGTLHARAFCHATEDLDKVMAAMRNALGEIKTTVSKTDGVHGNPIVVLEAVVDDDKRIAQFLAGLRREDLEEVMRTIDSRIDDGCNFFLRMDKQEAYRGNVRLGIGDDVISVRIRVLAFPARRVVAEDIVRQYLSTILGEKK